MAKILAIGFKIKVRAVSGPEDDGQKDEVLLGEIREVEKLRN